MDNDPRSDKALAALFDAAQANAPETTPDFMAALMRDAEGAMPKTVEAQTPVAPTPSFLSGLLGLFAASGLTGAAALGVWIGFVMPETLNTLADGFATDQTVSLSSFLPGADLLALSE